MGYTVYGGTDAPYVWVSFDGRDSWEVFTEILEKTNIVTTPAQVSVRAGNGYVRCSARVLAKISTKPRAASRRRSPSNFL